MLSHPEELGYRQKRNSAAIKADKTNMDTKKFGN